METLISDFAWLADFSGASCLSVAVGTGVSDAASAFGIDLDDPVGLDSERWSTERLAAVVPVAAADEPTSVVFEDNGFEGSREVVLRTASRGGRAASIFWNINGMVVFSCARRGKLLWSGELGMGADLDGLPRSLILLAETAEADDERDPVTIGAAMVAVFTGVHVQPAWVTDVDWCTVLPHVDQPEPITAESSSLQWDHPDLLSTLVGVDPRVRRPLVHAVVHASVRQASLTDVEVVASAVDSVRVDGPGVVPPAFEAWERQGSRDNDQLWVRQDEAANAGGLEPLPEEEQRIYRAGWVASAVQYACHHDDLSALLGVAHAAVQIFRLDGLEDRIISTLTSAAMAVGDGTTPSVDGLPSPPSREARDQALEEQRRERQRAEHEAELGEEAFFWGGRTPTARMRASGGAYALAHRDRDLLDRLDPLPDSVLSEISDWAAQRVLDDAGLWSLPWVQDAARGGAELTRLFELLFSDPSVEHTDFIDETGMRVSRQAMALPAVAAFFCSDPFDAACTALSPAGDGPSEQVAAFYREARQRFGLS